jgi:hypothetical protein
MNTARRQHLGRRICSDLDGMPTAKATPGYFVVMIDHGRRGREAVVDPELTRANIVDRIASKQYDAIAFIHWCHDGECEDVTNALLKEAGFYTEPTWADGVMSRFDQLIAQIDHDRDTRKHEAV